MGRIKKQLHQPHPPQPPQPPKLQFFFQIRSFPQLHTATSTCTTSAASSASTCNSILFFFCLAFCMQKPIKQFNPIIVEGMYPNWNCTTCDNTITRTCFRSATTTATGCGTNHREHRCQLHAGVTLLLWTATNAAQQSVWGNWTTWRRMQKANWNQTEYAHTNHSHKPVSLAIFDT